MKIVQLSEHVWRCGIWMIIPVNVWIVEHEEGLTLVDGGIGQMAKGLLQHIERLGKPLKQIVLTHGHSDHVGSVKRILEVFPVPVYAHSEEIPFMEGRLPYPRRKKAEATVEAGLVQPLDMQGLFSGLKPIAAPGHSPGHTVFYHEEDGILLAGDLFTSKRGQLKRPMPMFTADMKQAIDSASVIGQVKPRLVSVCHGGDVRMEDPLQQLEAYTRISLAAL